MNEKLFWYVKRLKVMSYKELFHRFLELYLYFVDSFKYRNGWQRVRSTTTLNLAGRLFSDLDGKFSLLDNERTYSSIENELIFDNSLYFKKINIPPGFDLRFYWESQRFNDLFYASLDANSDESTLDHLKCWMAHNPPLKGVNYISTMECAIRCINLYAALSVLEEKGILKDELRETSIKFFLVNYNLIKNRISRFSSRGNHTFFEYGGLLVCSVALGFKASSIHFWKSKFFEEFDFQTNNDGSGVEQSTSYHLFNADLFLFIYNYFECNSFGKVKFERALKFLGNFVHSNKIVRIGDCDSSKLFSRVFVIERLAEIYQDYHADDRYPEAGLSVRNNDCFKFILKYGGLGLAPLYAHGHYDFLSIYILSKCGLPITLDSQTYLYNTAERHNYRSSKYHSMPVVGKDDIKQNSGFSWSHNKTGTYLGRQSGWDCFSYSRGNGDIIYRKVCLFLDMVLILDSVKLENKDRDFKVQWLLPLGGKVFAFCIDSSRMDLLESTGKKYLDFSNSYGSLSSKSAISLGFEATGNSMILSVFTATGFIEAENIAEIHDFVSSTNIIRDENEKS